MTLVPIDRDRAVSPHSAIDTELAQAVGELPGVYAWWIVKGRSLPRVEPSADGLLYIGIAPSSERSRATLRSRVVGNHLRGRVATSTLRRTIAAHLWEREGWTPHVTSSGKVALLGEQEAALTAWMNDNLLVTWCEHATPWDGTEPAAIAEHRPPLNSEFNREHPYYPILRDKRRAFVAAARAAGVETA